jgi:DNA-binding transcriptional ArsR family regulator
MSDSPNNERSADPPTDIHTLRTGRAVMDISLDMVFTILADRRRRILLRLLGTAETCGVETLVDQIVEREYALDDVAPDREKLRRTLTETHLPMLAEHGLLEVDERSGGVRYYGHPVVEEYLEHTTGFE